MILMTGDAERQPHEGGSSSSASINRHPQPQQRSSRGLGRILQVTALLIASMLLGYSIPSEYRMLRVQQGSVIYGGTISTTSSSPSGVVVASLSTQDNHALKTSTRLEGEGEVDRVDKDYSSTMALNVNTTTTMNTRSLKIAWLMSFPNSGTSYTGKMIRHVSQTYTGSNYGIENLGGPNMDVSVPVYDDQPTGPFIVDPAIHPEYTHPTDYILVKTHCGGRCERCAPRQYVETTYSFRHRCLSGKWRQRRTIGSSSNETPTTTTSSAAAATTTTIVRGQYSPDRVTKAIHLIRNPFDNIVSRFHLERRIGHIDGGQKLIGREYDNSRQGFRDFCLGLNGKYSKDESRATWLNNELDALTADIPCRADFFRYIEWHNLAFVTTRDMNLDTYVLHYDWYATRFEETVDELLDFLHLERRDDVLPFEEGKVYTDYFTEEERSKMKVAMQWMASPALWEHLKQYFDEEID